MTKMANTEQRKMVNTPITLEYAVERLNEALKNCDSIETQKWDSILRSQNDFRLRVREEIRKIKERYYCYENRKQRQNNT